MITIYAIRTGDLTHYVGATESYSRRKQNHKMILRVLKARMMPLRHCESADAGRIEMQIIRAYQARGECKLNHHSNRPYKAGRAADRITDAPTICPEILSEDFGQSKDGRAALAALLTPHCANPAAVALGRLGGMKSSEKKTAAARMNGKKGGWPKGRKRKIAMPD